MNFKHKFARDDKSTSKNRLGWYYERVERTKAGGFMVDDLEHWWVVHCHKPRLIAVKHFDEQFQRCEICGDKPPQRFLQELKLDYVRRKYELEN